MYRAKSLGRNRVCSADELSEFARANLAHFKAPRAVTFLAELPKTATGKIQKYVLRRGSAIAPQ
jgi:fatty-acyl-CoA synthase